MEFFSIFFLCEKQSVHMMKKLLVSFKGRLLKSARALAFAHSFITHTHTDGSRRKTRCAADNINGGLGGVNTAVE